MLIVDLWPSDQAVQVIFLSVNVCLTFDQQHNRRAPTGPPRVKWINGLIVPTTLPVKVAK
ncbi:hypothetical protein [Tunturiibacter gelidiferens]|uniref:Uncharacterized protein n=1 Tax=Tunturiibacter gelidiferens TaxID=3069689 RepID=A0AAU7Z1F4_9BACT